MLKMKNFNNAAASVLLVAAFLSSCSTQRKASYLRYSMPSAGVAHTADDAAQLRDIDPSRLGSVSDTLHLVDDEGRELILMGTARDPLTGETTPWDRLSAAVVTAAWRNVPERGGSVNLEFLLDVPRSMQDASWRTVYRPELHMLGDTVRLDKVIVNGDKYRKRMLRGFEQYEKLLAKIITDTTRLVDVRNLEIFLERNIPQIYAFKRDTNFVSDEVFATYCGVSEQQAIDHYTLGYLVRRNERRIRKRDALYDRLVAKYGDSMSDVRLDTTLLSDKKDFRVVYREVVPVRPGMRKIDLYVPGDVSQDGKAVYRIPRGTPITFYVSSLAGLAEEKTMYKSTVIERRVAANVSCNIEFDLDRANVEPGRADNARELARIRRSIIDVLCNEKFDVDSISIAAWASPEGAAERNARLAGRRADAMANYFELYAEHVIDSLKRSEGVAYDAQGRRLPSRYPDALSVRSRVGGENWDGLTAAVEASRRLSADDVKAYRKALREKNLDKREDRLRRTAFYGYLRSEVYPSLRTADVTFHMNRKGMVKDTIHTTEIDLDYAAGLQKLMDHDYDGASAILAGYGDYNAALALAGSGRNESARAVLKGLRRTPRTDYLNAIVQARLGNERDAVKSYLRACKVDRAFIHRGNLDPEVAELVRKYDLNKSFKEED